VGVPAFVDFFAQAIGVDSDGGVRRPYFYQESLATTGATVSHLLRVPTGLGKTAGAVLSWLWRRRFAERAIRENTPRRLVYCLPMRVLVEQTHEGVVRWLDRLGLLAGDVSPSYAPDPADPRPTGWAGQHGDQGNARIAVHLLMGGEDRTDWALWPERDAVLIGTQDMLLSRALNRGYAARRTRWPVEFGLLNNDCLWVFDEIQLMGPGLATGLQLEAFRTSDIAGKEYFGTERPCVSWYMSATASRRLLTSREWRDGEGDRRPEEFDFELPDADRADTNGVLGRRRLAIKQLEHRTSWTLQEPEAVQRILKRHKEMVNELSGAPAEVPRRTLVICNTVRRARAIHSALAEALAGTEQSGSLVLLHSRFRPTDRTRQQERLKCKVDQGIGQIVISTQVIEAGVDLSAAILWTEIAPLASIVQRLGRLNRAGEFGHAGVSKHGWNPVAIIIGLPLPTQPSEPTKKEREKHEEATTEAYLPYDRQECEAAVQTIADICDASPGNLDSQLGPALDATLHPPDYSLQRHELLDFFDTDANLSLGYTDTSPFVRGIDPDTDVYVLWREWDDDAPPFGYDVGGQEICPVPIWQVRGRDGLRSWREGFVWLGRERGWLPATQDNLLPGATLLLPARAGGYENNLGWTGNDSDQPVSDLYEPVQRPTDEDLLSNLEQGWQSIACHTADVQRCWATIYKELAPLDDDVRASIDEALLWHDYGKSIRRWQAATRLVAWSAGLEWPRNAVPVGKFSFAESPLLQQSRGAELRMTVLRLRRTFAPKLRHEVASALAMRALHTANGREATIFELLAEYLVMSHHGYVRKTLRDELPRDPTKFRKTANEVRGITEGTPVPGFRLDGKALPRNSGLSISCRQMGRSSDGSESWTQSVLRLLDRFGPFRLAYFESLIRAADCRASGEPHTDVISAAVRNTSRSSSVGSRQNRTG